MTKVVFLYFKIHPQIKPRVLTNKAQGVSLSKSTKEKTYHSALRGSHFKWGRTNQKYLFSGVREKYCDQFWKQYKKRHLILSTAKPAGCKWLVVRFRVTRLHSPQSATADYSLLLGEGTEKGWEHWKSNRDRTEVLKKLTHSERTWHTQQEVAGCSMWWLMALHRNAATPCSASSFFEARLSLNNYCQNTTAARWDNFAGYIRKDQVP